MAFEETLRRISMPVEQSIGIFKCVVVDANGNMNLPSAGGRVDGVTQDNNGTASGLFTLVGIHGISKVTVGAGNCSNGDALQANTDGTVTTLSGSNKLVGIALATGVSGDIIPVLLKLQG